MRLDKGPVGLLEQFRLRTLGQQPTEFGEGVAPSADVRDHYGADLLLVLTASTTGAPLSLTRSINLVNPVRLRAIAGQLTVGAAAFTAGLYIEFGVLVRTFSGTGVIAIPFGSQSYGVAAATQVIAAGTHCDIILPAGSQLYARIGGTAAGADHTLECRGLMENYTPLA